MPLTIRQSTAFRRDVKRLRRQGRDITLLEEVIISLVNGRSLAPHHRDHTLIGNWFGFCECHIQPDWLLIYRIEEDELQLVRTGSHAALFG